MMTRDQYATQMANYWQAAYDLVNTGNEEAFQRARAAYLDQVRVTRDFPKPVREKLARINWQAAYDLAYRSEYLRPSLEAEGVLTWEEQQVTDAELNPFPPKPDAPDDPVGEGPDERGGYTLADPRFIHSDHAENAGKTYRHGDVYERTNSDGSVAKFRLMKRWTPWGNEHKWFEVKG